MKVLRTETAERARIVEAKAAQSAGTNTKMRRKAWTCASLTSIGSTP